MSFRISQITTQRTIQQRRLIWLPLAIAAVLAGGASLTLNAQDTAHGPIRDVSSTQAKVPASAPAALPVEATGLTRISPEDVLDVYVYDVPELSRDYTVNSAGSITVPLLPKPVQAAGLSPDELARSLEESFRQSGRLSRPQITVSIKQSRRSVVMVDGAVKTPQAVSVFGRTTLATVLSQCGGRADDAGATITVIRGEQALHDLAQEGGSTSDQVTVEFKQLVDPNDPMSKFEVWPGDRVSVERAGIFYVLGQVARPGGYNLKSANEQVSVLQALALAGDITPIAKTDKAIIIRKDPKAPDGRDQIALNFKSILQGTSPDRILQADDILYVPVSAGKRALRTAGIIGTSVATAAGSAAVYARY